MVGRKNVASCGLRVSRIGPFLTRNAELATRNEF
jgi:hypothetical protein